ncbi:hypothetical protein GCM10018987_25180 [Streptomyces cremeus]
MGFSRAGPLGGVHRLRYGLKVVVMGMRAPTPEGVAHARASVGGLAGRGVTVISGLAAAGDRRAGLLLSQFWPGGSASTALKTAGATCVAVVVLGVPSNTDHGANALT